MDQLIAIGRVDLAASCGGANSKEIAYLMSVTASTVDVLLWRACRRVGAADREGLIRFFKGHAL